MQKNLITVFEHQILKVGQQINEVVFDDPKLKALEAFYGERGVPYYSLIYNGVKFNEYVGVIQVGDLTIEVLPKADKTQDKNKWQQLLIGMLKTVNVLDVKAPSSSSLKLKSNSILELYFALFIQEVEYLMHQGLIKKYRRKETNATSLKGNINFTKHIQKNLVHQERFLVKHTVYDPHHLLHQVIYKALLLLKQINTNNHLNSRIGALLLGFPEQTDVKVGESTFDKIIFNRKTESYRKALEVARLLLLNFHPDVTKGRNHVLALMFDMNLLWERFVYKTLRKGLHNKDQNLSITSQSSKYFWKHKSGSRSKIIPDIVINKGKSDCIVLDTKWKNLNGYNPSPNDLRQMYVYHEYFDAAKVALVYPGDRNSSISGKFLDPSSSDALEKECSVISISVGNNIKEWQDSIVKIFQEWD